MKNLIGAYVFGVAALASTGLLAAEGCYERAVRLQRIADKETRESKELYEKSLDSYLCAARKGNPRAAYLAAIMSKSGQTRSLPEETYDTLLNQAATAGDRDALAAVAIRNCEEGETEADRVMSRAKCRNPEMVVRNLTLAHDRGAAYAANYLGLYLERGQLGRKDIARAYKCFELGASRGFELAKRNQKRLQAAYSEAELTSTTTCFEGRDK
ncbi:hypothetical protein [uncultured Propionivibrio sp.]|uniref:hypothetical protein n=1 Tax=uncultured Propionivibrio sp. TaxID=426737 RepID=UPI0029BFDB97|nr:hypothetical protein [uncultured Propionivibrio sp.]